MSEPITLNVRPLTTERVADLATLFDQGGDPKWCWCAYFRVRGRNWTNSTAAGNREILETATPNLAEEGRVPGLLAYDREIVVGWVSLGPRSDYDRPSQRWSRMSGRSC